MADKKKEMRKLTDEELEKVNGGITVRCVTPSSDKSVSDANGMPELLYRPVQGGSDPERVLGHADGSPLNADEMAALLKYQTADGLLDSFSVPTEAISNVSDVDAADLEVKLMTMQNVYNMTLSTGKYILPESLAEYISEPSSSKKE